jgi:hypothetical protein
MAFRQILNRTGRDSGASDCDDRWHPTGRFRKLAEMPRFFGKKAIPA